MMRRQVRHPGSVLGGIQGFVVQLIPGRASYVELAGMAKT